MPAALISLEKRERIFEGQEFTTPPELELLFTTLLQMAAEIKEELQLLPWEIARVVLLELELLTQGKMENFINWVMNQEAAVFLFQSFGEPIWPGAAEIAGELHKEADMANHSRKTSTKITNQFFEGFIETITNKALAAVNEELEALNEERKQRLKSLQEIDGIELSEQDSLNQPLHKGSRTLVKQLRETDRKIIAVEKRRETIQEVIERLDALAFSVLGIGNDRAEVDMNAYNSVMATA